MDLIQFMIGNLHWFGAALILFYAFNVFNMRLSSGIWMNFVGYGALSVYAIATHNIPLSCLFFYFVVINGLSIKSANSLDQMLGNAKKDLWPGGQPKIKDEDDDQESVS